MNDKDRMKDFLALMGNPFFTDDFRFENMYEKRMHI